MRVANCKFIDTCCDDCICARPNGRYNVVSDSDCLDTMALVDDAYDLSFSRHRESDRDDLIALMGCFEIVYCICSHSSALAFGDVTPSKLFVYICVAT